MTVRALPLDRACIAVRTIDLWTALNSVTIIHGCRTMPWSTVAGGQEECVGLLYMSNTGIDTVVTVVYLFLVCYGRSKGDQIHIVIPSFLQVRFQMHPSQSICWKYPYSYSRGTFSGL